MEVLFILYSLFMRIAHTNIARRRISQRCVCPGRSVPSSAPDTIEGAALLSLTQSRSVQSAVHYVYVQGDISLGGDKRPSMTLVRRSQAPGHLRSTGACVHRVAQ